MDKSTTIRMCNRFREGEISLTEVSMLITDYCLEHNKSLDKISKFITFLINTPFMADCVLTALEYYKRKFNVVELKRNNEVLLIY